MKHEIILIGLNSISLEIAIRLYYNKICKGLNNKLETYIKPSPNKTDMKLLRILAKVRHMYTILLLSMYCHFS